jgi:Uma2 family endonuclease
MKFKYDFPRYTYNDYKNWKEDWELIDGFPMQLLPSASVKHNKTQMRFIGQSLFSIHKNSEECVCEIFSELDWKISEETVVRPDLMIFCGKTAADFLEFPPILIVEVISPSSIKNDRVIKFDLYREQGVKYYIMADYTKETVEVYELIDNYYKQVDRTHFMVDKNSEIVFDFNTIWK